MNDKPYTLKDRKDDAAYVGKLLGPWERIVDCRRLHATIEALDAARVELQAWKDLAERNLDAHQLMQERDGAQQENERLREALEDICDGLPAGFKAGTNWDKAQAALESSQGEKK